MKLQDLLGNHLPLLKYLFLAFFVSVISWGFSRAVTGVYHLMICDFARNYYARKMTVKKR